MPGTYSLSYTAAGLRRAETVSLAAAYAASGDWAEVRRRSIEEDLLMIRQESSRKRVTSELIKRLKNLTPAELAFLASTADSASVDAVIWVAICRTYEFIETFVTNVVAERWREGTTTLTEGVYEAFASEQAALHPKLAGLSGQTTARLRSQLFTIMREMRFLEKDGTLLPYLIPSAAKALLPDEDLSLFPTAVS